MLMDILKPENQTDEIYTLLLGVTVEQYQILNQLVRDHNHLVRALFFLKCRPIAKYFSYWLGIDRIKNRDLPPYIKELMTALSQLWHQMGRQEQWILNLSILTQDGLVQGYLNGNVEYPSINTDYNTLISNLQPPLKDKVKEILPNPNLAPSPVKPLISLLPNNLPQPHGSLAPLRLDFSPERRYLFFGRNLDVKYVHKRNALPTKALFIEGNELHRAMARHEQLVRYGLVSANDTKVNTNIVIASISFVLSKLPLNERNPNNLSTYESESVSIEVAIPSGNSYQAKFTHNGEVDIIDLKNMLLKNAREYLKEPHVPLDKINPASDLHSETMLFLHLMNPATIKYMVDKIMISRGKGYRLYAVILDIHSTNNLCKDCAPLTLGLQHSHTSGFLKNLIVELKSRGFVKLDEKEIRMLTRYSYDEDIVRPSTDYIRELDRLDDAELKDVKGLYSCRAILHANEKSERFANVSILPKHTLFLSGWQNPTINTNNALEAPTTALNNLTLKPNPSP
jgi:hypothetical protein